MSIFVTPKLARTQSQFGCNESRHENIVNSRCSGCCVSRRQVTVRHKPAICRELLSSCHACMSSGRNECARSNKRRWKTIGRNALDKDANNEAQCHEDADELDVSQDPIFSLLPYLQCDYAANSEAALRKTPYSHGADSNLFLKKQLRGRQSIRMVWTKKYFT